MNNLEHAIEIIENEHDPFAGPIDAPSLVYALNDAGLIAAAPDPAHTVVEKAAQIERLQAAIRALSYPCAGDLIGLIDKGVLSKEDMEDTDE